MNLLPMSWPGKMDTGMHILCEREGDILSKESKSMIERSTIYTLHKYTVHQWKSKIHTNKTEFENPSLTRWFCSHLKFWQSQSGMEPWWMSQWDLQRIQKKSSGELYLGKKRNFKGASILLVLGNHPLTHFEKRWTTPRAFKFSLKRSPGDVCWANGLGDNSQSSSLDILFKSQGLCWLSTYWEGMGKEYRGRLLHNCNKPPNKPPTFIKCSCCNTKQNQSITNSFLWISFLFCPSIISIAIASMCWVYLPTFTITINQM